MQEANIPFAKTHDLEELLHLIVPTLPTWNVWLADFKIITAYAAESRYSGDSATAENTKHALKICEEVRGTIHEHLNP